MRKNLVTLLLLSISISIWGNDGGFYVDGNQLIPMTETNISVKKEILTINRSKKNPQQAEVIVYYEFYNPGDAKTMTVGFEADSPSGDADIAPVKGEQPYIHNFTVEMNNQRLPYQVAIVNDSIYYQNGKFKALTQKQINEALDGVEEYVDFRYAYHFEANFKKGLNIIKHTYTCDFSTFVMSNYEFGYILTAAMRWGNKQIDDFTLNINMGDDQLVDIAQTFFKNPNEWVIAGVGKKQETKSAFYEDLTSSLFYIKNGYLIFQKLNFKPKGELHISSPRPIFNADIFDAEEMTTIPNRIENGEYIESAADDFSMKVLRNIPFAKRGYIFTNQDLQKYFENQIWYIPDPNYKSDVSGLSSEEQIWVKKWSGDVVTTANRVIFNAKETVFISNKIEGITYKSAADDFSKKVLRNIPFAKRGYVFTGQDLQKYFEKQSWYNANPNYKSDVSKLQPEEQAWVEKWSK